MFTPEERTRMRKAAERRAAKQAAEIAAYEAHRRATMTPDEIAAQDANARRCAEWDRRNTM